jgi:hypothetical protein
VSALVTTTSAPAGTSAASITISTHPVNWIEYLWFAKNKANQPISISNQILTQIRALGIIGKSAFIKNQKILK